MCCKNFRRHDRLRQLQNINCLCFATDEDGRAVENFCNTLFKCINYNLHEEMFCFNVNKQ